MDHQSVPSVIRTLLLVQSAQRKPPVQGDRRRTSALLSPLVKELEGIGLPFAAHSEGPWWVGYDHRGSPCRPGDPVIPTIVRGRFHLHVDTFRLAAQLAGFLSWRDVPEPPEADATLLPGPISGRGPGA